MRLQALAADPAAATSNRDWVLEQLGSAAGPLVAFAARRTILAAIDHSAPAPPRHAKRQKRPEELCGVEMALEARGAAWWIDGGFLWSTAGSTVEGAGAVRPSHAGVAEWLALCNHVLKSSRASSHPERDSGVDADAEGAPPSAHDAGVCVLRGAIANAHLLWSRCSGAANNSRGATAPVTDEDRMAIELFALVGRCLKLAGDEAGAIVTGVSFGAWSERGRGGGSDASGGDNACSHGGETRSNLSLPAPSVVLGSSSSSSSSSSLTSSSHPEVRLRALDTYLTLLRGRPEELDPSDFLEGIVIDTTTAAAITAGTIGATSRSAECAFISPVSLPRQILRRSIALWARALQVSTPASVVDRAVPWHDDPGRLADALADVLADDDQLLVQTFCDLTAVAQAMEKHLQQRGADAPKPPPETSSLAAAFKGPLHPWKLFHAFLRLFSYDERCMLDLLLSNETVFLEYLLRVLKLSKNSPEGGADAQEVLTKMREAVVRAHGHGMFPYNPRALLSRFQAHFDSPSPQ